MRSVCFACALMLAQALSSASADPQGLSPAAEALQAPAPSPTFTPPTPEASLPAPAPAPEPVPTPQAEFEEFSAVVVRAAKPALGARYGADERQLKRQNLANVEDSFKYVPNVFVRKRYIGDANGVLQLRGTGMWQTARTQVLADGYLPLSFHLQTRFNGAPRWNLVSAGELKATEVEFGPFNAQYGGGSMGGVVNFITRQPQRREVTLMADQFFQDYSEYGSQGVFGGNKSHFSYADNWGAFSSFFFVDHLRNRSHPQTYAATTITAAPGAQPLVEGGYIDRDPRGNERVIYGETGPEDVTQDLLKWKLGYDGGRAFRAQATVAYNQFFRESSRATSYLRTTWGAKAWGNGNNASLDVNLQGRAFSVQSGDFAASTQERHNLLLGLSLKGALDDDLDYQLGGSFFRVLRDVNKQSSLSPQDPRYDDKGRVTRFEDTGWETAFVKLGRGGLWEGRLAVFGGASTEYYRQSSHTFNTTRWREGDNAAFNDLSAGTTFNHAVFGQATLGLLEGLDWTLGLRHDLWGTYGALRKTPAKEAADPERWESRPSPKTVLAWRPAAGWEARLGAAQALRFPIVEELYQNRFNQTSTQLSNADLKPEDGWFYNLGLSRRFGGGSAQLNVYREDVKDSIFFQNDEATKISTYLNVDRVVTNGAELALQWDAVLGSRLDVDLNTAYNDARIVENRRAPSLEGNFFQRVPQWRAGAGLTRRWTDAFQTTLSGRYAGHQFNNLENDDIHDGYGSISRMLVFDLSARWQAHELVSLSAGVDNLFNERYYSFHPLPQRSYHVGARARF